MIRNWWPSSLLPLVSQRDPILLKTLQPGSDFKRHQEHVLIAGPLIPQSGGGNFNFV
jgi:hypothetical protein